MDTPDTNRLEDLRSKFLQMTSPQEFGQERKENVTIISRNVPPVLARADAAFVVLSDALRNISPEHATIDYDTFVEIAENAREQAVNADQLTRADSIRADFSDLLDSLDFLCRNLNLLKAASEVKNLTYRRAESICTPCDPDTDFFRRTECALLKNLQDTLIRLTPAFQEKRQIFLESFSKADMDRFSHAHTSFTDLCKNKIGGPGHDQKN